METVVSKADADKLRGGYYTPAAIASFITKWAIAGRGERILEPSCGDGNFVVAAIERLTELGVPTDEMSNLIQGVELITEEADKTRHRIATYGVAKKVITNNDFFSFISRKNRKNSYDVIIGNPPFIRYQNFPEEHRELAFKMMEELGLAPNKLTNIWVPFLVISASLLTENGKLGMVIPAELFQVKYAAETRVFLSNFFPRVTIVTFKKLVFNNIQQEVVLLLCEKNVEANKGIQVVELSTLEDLEKLDIAALHKVPVKVLEHNSEKWIKYFLEEDEIQLLREIKKNKAIRPVSDIMDVDVGLVTGCNDFFMINEEIANKWGIKPYTIKVVSKSNHLKGIAFNDQDFEENSADNVDCYMFLPPNVDFDELPAACQAYIKYGEKEGFNDGYKCKIRKRWYITPSVWQPAAFALRQVNTYPKIIINQTDSSSTDTIHRVRFKKEVNAELLALSFFNSLSFAFSEILGRSYGGGVLTFEPSEVEEIPLPLFSDVIADFERVDALVREKRIEEAMDIVDQALLVEQLGLSKRKVKMLREIWKKLRDRRITRKLK